MQSEPKVVLLVEDDASLCEAIAESLADEGYKVVSAVDGQDALDWLSGAPAMPQVIITDLLMPRVDGWELWRRLRAESQWRAIPVFVLSSALHTRAWPADAQPLQQLRKPPDLYRLLRMLSEVTDSRAAANC